MFPDPLLLTALTFPKGNSSVPELAQDNLTLACEQKTKRAQLTSNEVYLYCSGFQRGQHKTPNSNLEGERIAYLL